MQRQSVSLLLLRALLQEQNSNIITNFTRSGSLVVSNLSSKDIQVMKVPVNDPKNYEPVYLAKVLVYLNKNSQPTEIYGLNDILKASFNSLQAASFQSNNKVFQPFIDDFEFHKLFNGVDKIKGVPSIFGLDKFINAYNSIDFDKSIDAICSVLSLMSSFSANTIGSDIKYTFIFDNKTDDKCNCH